MNRLNRFALTFALVSSLSFIASAGFSFPQTTDKAPVSTMKLSKAELATGTWAVDKAHTDIAFTATHMGVSKTRGSFTDFDGTVIADGKHPEKSSVQFTIKTASINTGNAQRDEHLKSKDFLEADKYPEMTFKSTKIVKSRGGFTAIGNFTLHGVTKQISLLFTVSGPQKGFKNEFRMGVDTAIALSRKEYGLTWNAAIEGSQVVGDIVNVTISMELTK